MGIKINKEEGYTEAIIEENCDYDQLYSVAKILTENFDISFTEKLDGLDTSYWDFDYNCSKLSLHYNIYSGISIFPIAFKESSAIDNQNVTEIGNLIFQKINY